MGALDIVAITLSVLSLLLSVSMWVYKLWKNRSNIRATFDFKDNLHFCCITGESRRHIFLHVPVLFENCSTLPISITQVVLVDANGNSFRAHFLESFASHSFRKLIDTDGLYEKIRETAKFPIEIGALGAKYEILSFSFPASKFGDLSKVRIYSNRYIWKILNKDNAMPSDRTIADICREFKVSEEWIRTGNGAMFADYKDYADLDLIMTEIQESDDDLIKSIVRAYWKLPDEKKAAIRDLVDGIISNLEKEKTGD